jgi:hypothetical protein
MKILLPNGVLLFVRECRKFDITKGVLNIYTGRERELAHFVIAHIAGYWFDNEAVEIQGAATPGPRQTDKTDQT